MAKSKVRGGAKKHRARVASRNQKMTSAQTRMQKLFNEAIQKEMEELKKQKEESEKEQSDVIDVQEIENKN